MSLKDYAVTRDKFQLRKDGSHALSLDFPCCHCSYCFKAETDEPCRTCDHNSNAVKDPQPVQSDQSDDAPQPCENCNGRGVISFNPNLNPNEFPGVELRGCTRCNGTGESPDEDRREKSESRAGIPPFQLRGPTNH
jgi:DnaJ-class molecular chaperone